MFRFSYHGGRLDNFPYRKLAAGTREQVGLDLREEALRYLQVTKSFRQDDELRLTGEIAEQLDFYNGTDVVSIIPAHVDEYINYQALARHIDVFSGAGAYVVIFVNDSIEHDSTTTIESKVDAMTAVLNEKCHGASFHIVGHRFQAKKSIGAIRGIITDAVLVAAINKGMRDPVAVSNDIDLDFTPDDYVHRIRKNFAAECMDVVTGPLYYGYTVEGREYGAERMRAPELVLANRLLSARKSIRLEGALDGGRFFATEGPHTAFRLSSYCAVGGYDFSMTLSEDDELGMALFRLRVTADNPYPAAENANYDDEFWLVTNARRQLQAIVSGYSVTDTWVHYPIEDLMGQSIDINAVLQRYRRSSDHLQIDDYSSDLYQTVPDKVVRRVARTLQLSLKNVSLTRQSAEHFCRIYGVGNVDLCSPGDGYRELTLTAKMVSALLRCSDSSTSTAIKPVAESA